MSPRTRRRRVPDRGCALGVTLRVMDERDERTTDSGIELRPVYGADDLVGFDPAKQLGEPGEQPFTRGVYPTMYRERLWTMRQYAGMGTAAETNRRFRYLLDQGQTGLSVAFDLPTQMGLDSDHPRAEGEVGKTGVAIDSIDDMRRLFEDDPARSRDDVDDDQRDGRDPAAALRAGRRGAGRGRVEDRRHRPERPAEGVRGARHLHLPAAALDADHHRSVRVLRRADPTLEHDLDQRLPHARGGSDGGTGDRVHARERHRVRAGGAGRGPEDRRLRAPALVLLRVPHALLRGDREVPRGAADVGADHDRAVRGEGSAERDAAVPHADGRRHAHGAAAARTTSSGRRSRRWPRCSAARSRCTPTRSTRRWRCRPSARSRSRSARSR